MNAAPVTLFYSYAHEDEELRDQLDDHLKIFERRGMIQPWHDREIVPGKPWNSELEHQLRNADLVLLLISGDFIASDFIWKTELEIAMERHSRSEASVVPILIRAVNIEPGDAWFMGLEALPSDLKAVTSWSNRDEAWANVTMGLRRTIESIQANRKASPPPAARAVPRAPTIESLSEDPLLQRVVNGIAGDIERANDARGGPPLDAARTTRQVLGLIDTPKQKRVLWVDDRPEGNRREIAVLNKLHIEVVTVRSTEAAMTTMATDTEGFDLVISDWERHGEPPNAGLELLHRLRKAHFTMPVVYYHGAFDATRRAERAASARKAGALGEAIAPGELLALVVKAVSS